MNSITSVPSTGQASLRFYKLCAQVLQQPSQRHQSTYRRTRQRLNIKPDASFLPNKTETHDHIIHNPPPSMPNVYHTPVIFLPKHDQRRQLQKPLLGQTATNLSAVSQSTQVGPPLRQPREKQSHVTPEQMEEMRALRAEDPYKWSIIQLSKKYDCANPFVRSVVQGIAKDKVKVQKMVTEVVKSRWGSRRRTARDDRAIRKERWLRDA